MASWMVGKRAAPSNTDGGEDKRSRTLGEAAGRAKSKDQQRAGKGDEALFNMVVRLLDQLEARVRELEGVAIINTKGSTEHPEVREAKAAGGNYAEAVKGNRDHDLGGPRAHIALAFLLEMTKKELPAGADLGLKQRMAVLAALASFAASQALDKVEGWIHMFRVSDMFQKTAQAKMTRVAFCLKGTILLPKGVDLAVKWAGAEVPIPQDRFSAVVVEGLSGQPEAAQGDGRVAQVQDLLTSVMASVGYTRLAGKAPRGKLAYKVHRALLGKVEDEADEAS